MGHYQQGRPVNLPPWISRAVPLAPLTSMGVGGNAAFFAAVEDVDQLIETLRFGRTRGLPILILGGGSNLVVSDDGFPGLVVWMSMRGLQHAFENGRVNLTVAAGESMDGVCAWACKQEWAGIECLSGIPGSAGAGPIQNIGAYGQELSECVRWVEVMELRDGSVHRFDAQDCGFAYRHSRFKRDPSFAILSYMIELRPGQPGALKYRDLFTYFDENGEDEPAPSAVREAVIQIRRKKSMILDSADPYSRGCGSFFTNPIVSQSQASEIAASAPVPMPQYPQPDGRVKLSAAWLIEQAGYPRGSDFGSVALSPQHALALINLGGAQTADLMRAATLIRAAVHQRFQVELIPEPVLVGCSLTP